MAKKHPIIDCDPPDVVQYRDLDESLEQVVAAVRATARYQVIAEDFVRRLAALELAKGRSVKEAIKATRSKLHQVGAAYQEQPIAYARAVEEMVQLPAYPQDERLRQFCRAMMAQHASTRERLPLLETFYARLLAPLAPIHSVLDLACGLNPLALPWMPLAPDAVYHACDIYVDMVTFLNQFLTHLGQKGSVTLCDLTQEVPSQAVQVAFLLKTLPCLEQLDKAISPRLLESIRADYLLVSFPARSLGGRSKGMPAFYEAHFLRLLEGKNWQFQRFEFATELVFLIHTKN